MAAKLFLSKQSKLWSNREFRSRVIFLLGSLIVFRIGSHIPVPGVDANALAQVYQQGANWESILSMFNIFSGGALERFSILQSVLCLIYLHQLLCSWQVKYFLLLRI